MVVYEGILRLQYDVIDVGIVCFELLIGERALNHHLLSLLMQFQRAFYPHGINLPGGNQYATWLLMQV